MVSGNENIAGSRRRLAVEMRMVYRDGATCMTLCVSGGVATTLVLRHCVCRLIFFAFRRDVSLNVIARLSDVHILSANTPSTPWVSVLPNPGIPPVGMTSRGSQKGPRTMEKGRMTRGKVNGGPALLPSEIKAA